MGGGNGTVLDWNYPSFVGTQKDRQKDRKKERKTGAGVLADWLIEAGNGEELGGGGGEAEAGGMVGEGGGGRLGGAGGLELC